MSRVQACYIGAFSAAILAGTACSEPAITPVDAAREPFSEMDANNGGPFDGDRPRDSFRDGGGAIDASDARDAGGAGDAGNAFDATPPPPTGGSTMDASAPDAGTDEAPSFCDGVPGAMFCDDFEGDLSRWTADTMLGRAERDVNRSYNSAASFKSELLGLGRAHLEVDLPESVAEGVTLYVQMRVFVPDGLKKAQILWLGGQQGTSLILEDWTKTDSLTELNLFPWNTIHGQWIGSAQFKHDRWTCLDLRIALDKKSETAMPKGAFEARIDGAVAIASAPIFTFESNGPFEFRLGLATDIADQGAFTAWFDDVVIDTEPLPPCSELSPTLPNEGAGAPGG